LSRAADAGASNNAVAYQIDVAHSGQGTLKRFKGKLKLLWNQTLVGDVSYPLVANNRVFVTVAASPPSGSWLYALNLKNGKTVWQRTISGTYNTSSAAYDDGQVFVVNFDGVLSAFDAGTGALNWTAQLEPSASMPVAQDGTVFVGGAAGGGAIFAVDETTGHVKWSASNEAGGAGTPALANGDVYVSIPCQTDSLSAKTGQINWYYNGYCSGQPLTQIYFGDQVYARVYPQPAEILNAETGALAGTVHAQLAPSFFTSNGATYAVAVWDTELSCTDVASGTMLWTYEGASTAPLVIGNYVIDGAGAALYVLNRQTGKKVWSTTLGSAILTPEEGTVANPLPGLGAGGNVLIVPASSQIYAFVAQ
jgi:outer membrane protein assembly factor BamB